MSGDRQLSLHITEEKHGFAELPVAQALTTHRHVCCKQNSLDRHPNPNRVQRSIDRLWDMVFKDAKRIYLGIKWKEHMTQNN